MNNAQNEVPDYLLNTYNMLSCAYPDGLSGEEYWSVLLLLHSHMSHRALAQVVSVMSNKHYIEVYNDIGGVAVNTPPLEHVVAAAREKLADCGYEIWIVG